MAKIALRNRPMANMRRIRRQCRNTCSALGPGTLILTDDGLLGRVRRRIERPGTTPPIQLEVDDLDGGVALVTPQDVRLVYG